MRVSSTGVLAAQIYSWSLQTTKYRLRLVTFNFINAWLTFFVQNLSRLSKTAQSNLLKLEWKQKFEIAERSNWSCQNISKTFDWFSLIDTLLLLLLIYWRMTSRKLHDRRHRSRFKKANLMNWSPVADIEETPDLSGLEIESDSSLDLERWPESLLLK